MAQLCVLRRDLNAHHTIRRVVPPGCSTHLVFYSIGTLITNLQSDPFERLKNILTIYRIYSTPFIQILVLFISGLTMPDYGRFNSLSCIYTEPMTQCFQTMFSTGVNGFRHSDTKKGTKDYDLNWSTTWSEARLEITIDVRFNSFKGFFRKRIIERKLFEMSRKSKYWVD